MYFTFDLTIPHDDLNRRVLRFVEVRGKVVLDYDADETRSTKRHKWVRTAWWSRLGGRDNTIKEQRELGLLIKTMALEGIRSQITFGDEP